MGDLKEIQKKFAAAAAILGLAVLVLMVYLMWPGYSRAAVEAQQAGLQDQFNSLSREVKLWESSNPDKTRADLKILYTDIPSRYSEISQHIQKLSQGTGVSSQSIKYSGETGEKEKIELADVQRIRIDVTISGDYAKVAGFINAMEQDSLFFVIEKISLSGQAEGGAVSLQITFDTFLKGAA
jgi:hypothetical protein